jgi:hypothetical protein
LLEGANMYLFDGREHQHQRRLGWIWRSSRSSIQITSSRTSYLSREGEMSCMECSLVSARGARKAHADNIREFVRDKRDRRYLLSA